ncbi:ABC transporter substrate-binding protein [Kushneria aurantia]|uniref:ABC transporter substrate-binding protein n=1 Tax=Kushneria aurantia TaxID=504092 RepID=A0ABV6G005_9GAMM|nr:ABC transporter substrate-binding protein [Kushneria aurantia]
MSGITTFSTRLWKPALGVLALVLLAGCSGGDDEQQASSDQQSGEQAQTFTIGSTNFPEQLVLAHIYADVLEADGVDVNTRLNLGSREVVFPALLNGEIDMLPEYTGALMAYLDDNNAHADARTEQQVTSALREVMPQGIVALDPSPAQDRDVLVVTSATASQYDLQTYSDLAPVAGELTMGGPPETRERDTGLPGLERVYGITFGNFRSLDAGGPLTRGALSNGDIDVARMFSTQGAIAENGWVILRDDKNLVPAQNIIPVAREDALTPEIRDVLNRVSAALTTEDLQQLNRQVEVDKADPADVAQQWVDDNMSAEES